MALLTMAPSEPHTPNGVNGHHTSSDGTSPVSTSPESTRSGKSAASGNGSSSRASQHLYMINGARSQNPSASSSRRGSGRENGVVSPSAKRLSHEQPRKLPRAKTEIDLIKKLPREAEEQDRELRWEVRHGWSQQYYSQEILTFIQKVARPKHSA